MTDVVVHFTIVCQTCLKPVFSVAEPIRIKGVGHALCADCSPSGRVVVADWWMAGEAWLSSVGRTVPVEWSPKYDAIEWSPSLKSLVRPHNGTPMFLVKVDDVDPKPPESNE